ncbi:hypothetical protein BH23BAC1_BH23BAC1_00230 [soil metagenome]
MELVEVAMFNMYNLNSTESEKCIEKIEDLLPVHPVSPFLKALNIYWKEMPIHSKHSEFGNFIALLQETIDRSASLLEKDKKNEEAIFFSLAAHGYLAQYYADEKSIFKAIREANNTYSYMKLGFNMLYDHSEFYYTTGLYNYYREQYPEMHPLYKPFMWFFAGGNKQLGLEQLKIASQDAVFTRVEALNYAAHINLRYELNPAKAEKFAVQLVKEFSRNNLYKAIYIETLLTLEKFSEARPLIFELESANSSYFKMIGEVYKATLLEKQEKKYEQAKISFNRAIEFSSAISIKTDHYKSMSYCGLARLSLKSGDNEAARDHYKKALGIAQYYSVKKEAEKFLNKNRNIN